MFHSSILSSQWTVYSFGCHLLAYGNKDLVFYICSKSILNEYLQLSSDACKESVTQHSAMVQAVACIVPKKEYSKFIESNQWVHHIDLRMDGSVIMLSLYLRWLVNSMSEGIDNGAIDTH